MAMSSLDWEKITPENLLPAIKHLRESFESSEWKCSRLTEVLCYAALHPKEAAPRDFGHYLESFRMYRVILGRSAEREFDRVLAISTAPAIFKAYQDAFRHGIELELERLFEEVLQIALANASALNRNPVDWAKAQLSLMLEGSRLSFSHWIKSVCDKQDFSHALSNNEDFDDFIFWKSWQAPKFVYMTPSGNLPYNASTAWVREDEAVTEKALKALTDRFVQFAGFRLDEAAGNAHVRLAKAGTNPSSAAPRQGPDRQETKWQTVENNVKGPPTAFVSYSWDSPEHRKWVLQLGTRLRQEGGIDVILDQWDLTPGRDKTTFMETGILKSDFAVLICTPKYADRANKRDGGVGYEAMVITGELASKIDQDKFIPVLREGEWEQSLPIWVRTKRGVDLRGEVYSEDEYESLVRAIHRESLAPPIGPRPVWPVAVNETQQEHWDDNARLLKGMAIIGRTHCQLFDRVTLSTSQSLPLELGFTRKNLPSITTVEASAWWDHGGHTMSLRKIPRKLAEWWRTKRQPIVARH